MRLLAVKNEHARRFYETEALRGGWSVRQLNRQIGSQSYERTALSRNKAAMLRKGAHPQPEDTVSPEDEIKDPYVLEFLGLKDEYSETDLEAALIRHLERFLLEPLSRSPPAPRGRSTSVTAPGCPRVPAASQAACRSRAPLSGVPRVCVRALSARCPRTRWCRSLLGSDSVGAAGSPSGLTGPGTADSLPATHGKGP